MVVVQPLLRQRFLFGGKADLFGATAGIADGQDPDQMAGAFGQTLQPLRWRMRRCSKEPRRISVVEGSLAASWVRALRIALCFILINETHKRLIVKCRVRQRQIKFHSLR